ncbi:hypothetical protein HOP50_16g77260 [Chloropicon primus]|uniref:Uncharacterized protein n=1 Tax=Chloropicon primus TaxID=1764295 RepID=A0A5B8N092_9CHLO|nr:hypothetical protein A3770_16p76980 [Chloropicon primus]UPR04385.1 hypothetical protein HOP50_16g77260 [Chloropicon primus]|eukprot:QDZ25180.1 hypothetical protein A3770_16p76980 [Chloropicon primus]
MNQPFLDTASYHNVAPLAIVNANAQRVNRIVASQLAQRARTMSDKELEILFEDLLDAKADTLLDGSVAAKSEETGGPAAPAAAESAEEEEEEEGGGALTTTTREGQTYTFAGSKGKEDSLEVRQVESMEDALMSELDQLVEEGSSRVRASGEEGTTSAGVQNDGGGEEFMGMEGAVSTFIDDHLVSLELAGIAVVAATALALTARFLGSIFSSPEEEEEEEEGSRVEGTAIHDSQGQGGSHYSQQTTGGGGVSFGGRRQLERQPEAYGGTRFPGNEKPSAGGVVWSRQEEPEPTDGVGRMGRNSAQTPSRKKTNSVVWTRGETSARDSPHNFSPASRVLEDNVE